MKSKLALGVGLPFLTLLSLCWHYRMLIIPVPMAKFSRLGFSHDSLRKIIAWWGSKLIFTWGARLHDLGFSMSSIVSFEDGFYRSKDVWRKQPIPEKITYEFGYPYYCCNKDSRLALNLKSFANMALIPASIEEKADAEILAIRSGRCKYGWKEIEQIEKSIEDKTIMAVQTEGDFSITYSPNKSINFKEYEAALSKHDETLIKYHPLDSNRSNALSTMSIQELAVSKIKCLCVYNSTLGLEAITCGIPVTYYGETPIANLIVADSIHYPLTILPSQDNIQRMVAACYVCYPLNL
ncbi:hypothetical protein ISG33_02375 [Glaciecola sp. MH2013]|uniref:hypothetical protein n=1 Tax=Glaciecola sp. MH2013 TaxID=2785524 RepID=UPI00189E97B1|nr:hypothetical protein [Glaciecola sp. MH2013]MBF7072247.1 hypothetical protein [Glaciecola sp. MH2013]